MTTNEIMWDPDHVPAGSGDPETDATPDTLLYIARSIWRLFAPDPGEVASLGRLTRAQRDDIAFWLAPLESLVRCILFLLLPRECLRVDASHTQPTTETGQGADRRCATPPSPLPRPSTAPHAPCAPRFRYWMTRPPGVELVFDFAEPEAEAAFAAFLAARDARRIAARNASPVLEVSAAPTARRMTALLDVLNDPLSHVDRLAALMRRHRPVMEFAPLRPRRIISGPRAPCAHALERGREALRRLADPLIGPLRPHWSSG